MPTEDRTILILTKNFMEGYGGTPESVLLIARQLVNLGVTTDVICDQGLWRDAGKCGRLPSPLDIGAFEPVRLRPAISEYDALFVAGSWNMRAPRLILQAKQAELPIVYAAKGCLGRAEFTRLRDVRRIPYLLLVEIWVIMAARHIIFTSLMEEKTYVLPRFIWRRRATIVPEPFEGGVVAGGSAVKSRKIGFLAEISPRKGLLELIAGFGTFIAARPDTDRRLVIAGNPRAGTRSYFAKCKALAIQNGSAAYIDWIGTVRGSDRAQFYAGLDFFVCPSRFESFGLTVLEALWQGIPVCAGPNLGVLEFMTAEAPITRMTSLKRKDVAAALTALSESKYRCETWAGRSVGTQTNAQIAQAYADMLFGER